MNLNRRSFIRNAALAAAGNAAGLKPFGMLNAMAQNASDYKALVCVFMYGGNDSNNMVVPFDRDGYGTYASLRGGLALPQNSLLQFGSMPNFSMHPSMGQLKQLIDKGAGAVLANVGTLIQPLTRAQVLAGNNTIPDGLFSHSGQQQEWQSGTGEGSVTSGWAGRIADQLAGTYNQTAGVPMITSISGDTLFCDGETTMPMSVAPGALGMGSCYEATYCTTRMQAEQALLTFDSGLSLVQADNAITSNGYRYAKALTDAVKSVQPLQTQFPAGNGLAVQLQQIAQIIQVRAALGVQRQIFFCGIGSFDTHEGQLGPQSALLATVSDAIASFYNATVELGVAKNVTTFTMSEFSRALQPNSANGSDHAWGSHHLVLGGGVQGGKMFGSFPTMALNGPDDSGGNGRWIPSTSTAQYAATMAKWFGVNPTQMAAAFPSLSQFKVQDLGFMG